MNSIKIRNKIIDDDHPVFVIAEAGINHNGSYKIAKKMIDVASETGVDCIKFQTHIVNEEMLKTNIRPGKISKETLWNIIKKCELTEKEEYNLNQYCKTKKILFLSTPFSIAAVDRLEKLKIPAYKIGSGELTNLPFLNHIAKTKKPVILSTGMSDMTEIKSAVKFFKKFNTPLAILQTTSEYPADFKDINLGVIPKFKKLFNIPVGDL